MLSLPVSCGSPEESHIAICIVSPGAPRGRALGLLVTAVTVAHLHSMHTASLSLVLFSVLTLYISVQNIYWTLLCCWVLWFILKILSWLYNAFWVNFIWSKISCLTSSHQLVLFKSWSENFVFCSWQSLTLLLALTGNPAWVPRRVSWKWGITTWPQICHFLFRSSLSDTDMTGLCRHVWLSMSPSSYYFRSMNDHCRVTCKRFLFNYLPVYVFVSVWYVHTSAVP